MDRENGLKELPDPLALRTLDHLRSASRRELARTSHRVGQGVGVDARGRREAPQLPGAECR